ncbi:hypothetical protein JQ621_12590 [Bradyrhizobium manausense]|uniref:hypothetical protein n=1 Tax=Bradyrhizobium manausense TaxID=989370 RepID=UPI001BA8FC3C|nr:hypothetical protein [Bradyrhizobium manausense]MBR1088302.1 hypothetical protein [Bradyrhizobium manausense]
MATEPSSPREERLEKLVGEEWQTAAQIRRLFGGESVSVIKALDCLWRAGRIEEDAQEIEIGAKRLGGGGAFQLVRYRRRAM